MYQPVGQLSIGVMEVLVHYVGFRLCFPRMSLSFRSLQWVHLDGSRKLWPTTPSTKDMKLELFECNTHNDLILAISSIQLRYRSNPHSLNSILQTRRRIREKKLT